MIAMRTVPTTEAKAKLNALLAEVASGATVTITSHGKPVAVLTKPEEQARRLGQLAGVVTVPDDFDASLDSDELALWGEA